MSARTRAPRGLVTARWGWQPSAWLLHGLPTWRPGRAPSGLVTSAQLRAIGLPRCDVAAAGQLHRPGPTRGPRGVVALWDLDEVRAHADLTTYTHHPTGAPTVSHPRPHPAAAQVTPDEELAPRKPEEQRTAPEQFEGPISREQLPEFVAALHGDVATWTDEHRRRPMRGDPRDLLARRAAQAKQQHEVLEPPETSHSDIQIEDEEPEA